MATRPKAKRKPRKHPAAPPPAPSGTGGIQTPPPGPGAPRFAQPVYTPDPASFRIPHGSDAAAYKILDAERSRGELTPMAFPAPRGGVEPIFTLAQAWGDAGPAIEQAAVAAGQLVFHAVGDTGNTRSTAPQNQVADKLVADFDEPAVKDVPRFFLHLGDVIYSFGEAGYYYDQFYEPYREYPAPIIALAGNHDGIVAPGSGAATLEAYLRNFCAEQPVVTAEAGGLERTAMIQPGAFFTLEAPFVRVLCLYSNTLEDPGVISSENGSFPDVGDIQLDYLRAALARVKKEKYAGALVIAHHHPVYTAGSKHGWSPNMLAEIDAICSAAGVWPHAVLSAHAHNFQRFTRTRGAMQTAYVIAGGGGHGLNRIAGTARNTPLRTPMVISAEETGGDTVVLENYDDRNYGYLRIIATAAQLRIEYHPAIDGAAVKSPDDFVTVDLKTRRLVHFAGVSG